MSAMISSTGRVMEKVGLSVAVADAHPLLIPRADYVTRIAGGRGAVREVCDLLLGAGQTG